MRTNVTAIETGLRVNRKTALRMAGVEFLKNTKVTEVHLATYDKLKVVITYKGARDEASIACGMSVARVLDRAEVGE